MGKLPHGHRAAIRVASLLIASLCCAPLIAFAATPTPPGGSRDKYNPAHHRVACRGSNSLPDLPGCVSD